MHWFYYFLLLLPHVKWHLFCVGDCLTVADLFAGAARILHLLLMQLKVHFKSQVLKVFNFRCHFLITRPIVLEAHLPQMHSKFWKLLKVRDALHILFWIHRLDDIAYLCSRLKSLARPWLYHLSMLCHVLSNLTLRQYVMLVWNTLGIIWARLFARVFRWFLWLFARVAFLVIMSTINLLFYLLWFGNCFHLMRQIALLWIVISIVRYALIFAGVRRFNGTIYRLRIAAYRNLFWCL